MFEVIEKNCPIRIRPKPREIELRGIFSLQFSRNRLLGFLARLTSSLCPLCDFSDAFDTNFMICGSFCGFLLAI